MLLVLVFAAALFAQGCGPAIQIKYSATPDGTVTAEYARSMWVNENIEGLQIVKDDKTGAININLKGQASESTALNSAVAGLVSIADIAAKAAKPAGVP